MTNNNSCEIRSALYKEIQKLIQFVSFRLGDYSMLNVGECSKQKFNFYLRTTFTPKRDFYVLANVQISRQLTKNCIQIRNI